MPASRMKEKRIIECKVFHLENGKFCSNTSPTEKRELNAIEAIKVWCKESQWNYARPQSIRMEVLLEKIMENFKVSREPAYRRIQRAIQEYECLTADVREKRKGVYIIYDRARDIQPTGKPTYLYKEPEISKDISEKVECEKELEEPIDIYKLLVEAERKHKERQLAKSTT